jgi:hypothetical protein
MPEIRSKASRALTPLREWARTPAGMWILGTLAFIATAVIIALVMTFS